MALRTTRLIPAAGLALLSLLCGAAMVNAAKSGAREGFATRKVLADPASDAAPAPAPLSADLVPLPEDFDGNYSMLPATMASRANAFQSIVEGAEDLAQEALRTCVWGNYCGGSCDGSSSGKDPLTGDGGLDQACYDHDRCLENNNDLQASTYCTFSGTPNCYCDSQLASTAWDIYNSNKKDCAWWNLFCWEEQWVMAARDVAISQDYRQYCGSCN